MENNKSDYQKVAIIKLELAISKALDKQRKTLLSDPIRSRINIEKLRNNYMLNDNTISMFAAVGMVTEYTNLLNRFNRILDGDYNA